VDGLVPVSLFITSDLTQVKSAKQFRDAGFRCAAQARTIKALGPRLGFNKGTHRSNPPSWRTKTQVSARVADAFAGKRIGKVSDKRGAHAGPVGSRTTTGICREPAPFW